MNAKQVFAVLAFAVAGNAVMAAEAEQFIPAAATLSRADVRAELAAADRDTLLVSYGEATVFGDAPVASSRTREDVRAEARSAAHDLSFNELYAG
jgi:hypothetical protein